jgi:hypothetical protein
MIFQKFGAICALLCSFTSLGRAAEEFFPVMAWNTPPADAAVLKKMRECGLTVAGFAAPASLDLIQASGLKAIVSDPRVSSYDWTKTEEQELRQKIGSLVAEVGKHPAVYGYSLRDEPSANMFPGLAKAVTVLHELAPEKWAYVNLFPNYAEPSQLGTPSYDEYLNRFIAQCKPTTLSYDHYALMDDDSLRSGYWQNLEQIRGASIRNNLPFWNIVLTVAHFNYREATAADLRFQVYSTLAYGGRGISYFTYFAPQVGNYRMAPVDQFGNPTETWNNLRNVNLQIEKLAPTLLRLKSDLVYHFGKVPPGCSGASEISLATSVSGEFAAGDFTHEDGSRYLMLVNKDLKRSRPCAIQFRAPPKKVELVSPYTGKLTAFAGEQIWAAPGQGVLLKLFQ